MQYLFFTSDHVDRVISEYFDAPNDREAVRFARRRCDELRVAYSLQEFKRTRDWFTLQAVLRADSGDVVYKKI